MDDNEIHTGIEKIQHRDIADMHKKIKEITGQKTHLLQRMHKIYKVNSQ